MRLLIALGFVSYGTGAAAHPGHILDVAGHGHWVGAAAIGLAILVGLWGKSKERDEADTDEDEEIEEEEVAA